MSQRRIESNGISRWSLLHRHDQPLHDVILALRRVFAHVEIEDRHGFVLGRVFDFAQAHLLADELLEFSRADFAQVLEPRNLRFAAEFLHGVVALVPQLRDVAMDRALLVAGGRAQAPRNSGVSST